MLFSILHHHLQQHDTPLAQNIQANLYVDNVISCCGMEQQAIQYLEEARSLLSSTGFSCRAWTFNSESLTKKVRESGVTSDSHLANILGLQWNTKSDQLSLVPRVNITMDRPLTTKREVLKDTSKLFDSLGIASPVSVRAKLFMQV